MFSNFYKIWLTIFVVIGITFILLKCEPEHITKNTTTIKYDTVYKAKNIYIESEPKIIKKFISSRYDSIQHDTVKIKEVVNDFYGYKIYNDTIPLDTIGKISIRDSVSQNKIVKRDYNLNYKIPFVTKTITNNIYQPLKSELYIYPGIIIGNKSLIGSDLIYNNHKTIYSVGVYTDNNLNVYYKTSIGFKIK